MSSYTNFIACFSQYFSQSFWTVPLGINPQCSPSLQIWNWTVLLKCLRFIIHFWIVLDLTSDKNWLHSVVWYDSFANDQKGKGPKNYEQKTADESV